MIFRTGGSRYDFGIKREGSIKTKRCPATYVNSKVFCWSFDADVRSNGSASNTCFGDSGGGVFMPDDDGGRRVLKVFGVVSGGRDRSCVKDDLSYNVDLGQFAAWIEAAGEGRLSSGMCGRYSSVSNMTSIVHLSERDDEALLALNVPAGTAGLRVAMSGEDNSFGNNDFDLLLFHGDVSKPNRPVCAEEGRGQFAFCQIDRPADGRWSMVIKRKKGEGDAQITTTLIASGDQ
jgi:hypothetical protein